MKYVIILGDGMGDYPIDKLGGKTPLAVANKPMMDTLATKGEVMDGNQVRRQQECLHAGAVHEHTGGDLRQFFAGRHIHILQRFTLEEH